MTDVVAVLLAYTAVFAAIGGYLLTILVRRRRLTERALHLERRRS